VNAAVPLLTAVTGRWEAPLVAGLERIGGSVVVVRRCADLADLLAAAATGQGRAAVLSADLRSLGGEALSRLALAGVAVVALVDPGDDAAQRPRLFFQSTLPVFASRAKKSPFCCARYTRPYPIVGGNSRVSCASIDHRRRYGGLWS